MRVLGIWLVILLTLLLAACGGGGESDAAPALDPQSPEGKGEASFRTYCAACHAVAGDRVVVGPSLDGIAVRAAQRVPNQSAEDYLYDSILSPDKFIVEGFKEGAMQQTFGTTLSSEELDQIVAYLLTLN